jgi:hypothetical protein
MSGLMDVMQKVWALEASLKDSLLLVETLMLQTKDPNVQAQCKRCLANGFKSLDIQP